MRANAGMTAAMRRLLPSAERTVLVMLLALFVFKAFIPAWVTLRSDFANYYLVARLLHQHYAMGKIYDWIWLQRVKDHWSIQQPLVGFVGLTPFSALPIVPLAWLDVLEAKRIWLVVNLAVLATSLFGLQRLTSLGARHVALIALLAIIPLRNSFLLGQMHLVVLGLLVLAYWLDTHKMWIGCGLALAIAASLKVYPLFFVLYFLRKRQWKPAAVLVCSTLAILAACFLIFGAPVMRVFLIEQFPRMLRGEAIDPFSLTSPSASSLFHRVFLPQPQLNPRPPIPSPLLYSLFYPLWQLSLFGLTLLTISSEHGDPRRRGLEWAAFTCLLVTLSTEPASYHRVVLIFVAILATYAIKSVWRRALMLGCYFVACNIHPSVSPLHPVMALLRDFLPYWGLLAMLACLLAALRGRPFAPLALWPAWPRMRIAWSLAGFTIVWCAASATTFVHARSLNCSEYLVDRTGGAYARFAPHLAGDHLLTVSMFPEGYRVEDEGGRLYRTGIDGRDEEQLAIASSPSASQVWIEAVSEGNSRLVELPAASSATAIAPIAIIPNAESPALSPDGRSLVFLREVDGAGRAWMVHLDESGRVLDAPFPVTPVGLNVASASFAGPDVILFSAVEDGASHLFVAHSGETPQRTHAAADAIDSPTVNIENGLLIYRQLSGGYWRLFANSFLLSGATQLTFGDCNAYDPAWSGASSLLYISDCGRGMGLGAVAIRPFHIVPGKPDNSPPFSISTNRPQGEAQQ
ncbi:MAG: glycosyltransferase 87 family protein [Terracidiphilus sp.]